VADQLKHTVLSVYLGPKDLDLKEKAQRYAEYGFRSVSAMVAGALRESWKWIPRREEK